MKKFFGKIGYGHSEQTAPGVWRDIVVEKDYFGDITRNSRQLREGEYVNDDLTVSNSISVIADAYANEHFHAIKYVKWAGAAWKVEEVTVEAPRLILRLGGVYNGNTTPVPNDP